ncbi:MAG: response regulator [Candidatus Gastranaerophilales bacterium]|nr:response regulator [Candidatus Gastranaerophilales bacterium]
MSNILALNEFEKIDSNMGKNVLIVEDSDMNLQLLAEIIENLGCNPTACYSCVEALEHLNKEAFDLILLDIMMPNMNGYKLLEELKKIPLNSETPVFIISALSETKDVVRGLKSGSWGYVTKPFKVHELSARIESLFKIIDLQNELKRDKEILHNINEFSNDAIVMLDRNNVIISSSKKFNSWFPKKKILGCDFLRIMQTITLLPDDFLQEKNYFLKLELDNSERILDVYTSEIFNEQNGNDGHILIMRDVTDEKMLEVQKDNFIATLTHDLKTPIRAEILSLELLLKGRFGELTNEQSEILGEMLNSSRFMFSMLDTLLAKYKYETDSVSLNFSKFDINLLIRSCIKELKYLFQEKHLEVVLNLRKEPVNIKADYVEIKRAITNLLSNAIKFNVEKGRVLISSSVKDDKLILKISDTGKGIPKEKSAYIFDRYFSYAKKFRQFGTGLGLYVTKKIIDSHNGTITVNSKEGVGTEFTIDLPLESA